MSGCLDTRANAECKICRQSRVVSSSKAAKPACVAVGNLPTTRSTFAPTVGFSEADPGESAGPPASEHDAGITAPADPVPESGAHPTRSTVGLYVVPCGIDAGRAFDVRISSCRVKSWRGSPAIRSSSDGWRAGVHRMEKLPFGATLR